jgi:hypothetical protein
LRHEIQDGVAEVQVWLSVLVEEEMAFCGAPTHLNLFKIMSSISNMNPAGRSTYPH